MLKGSVMFQLKYKVTNLKIRKSISKISNRAVNPEEILKKKLNNDMFRLTTWKYRSSTFFMFKGKLYKYKKLLPDSL